MSVPTAMRLLLQYTLSACGTKRATAYATDVRSWWKLTYERWGGIRVLTPEGTSAGPQYRTAANPD